MKLGVDFGTNRIVVAAADRGNYPLVSFEAPDGASPDWFPSLIAIRAIVCRSSRSITIFQLRGPRTARKVCAAEYLTLSFTPCP